MPPFALPLPLPQGRSPEPPLLLWPGGPSTVPGHGGRCFSLAAAGGSVGRGVGLGVGFGVGFAVGVAVGSAVGRAVGFGLGVGLAVLGGVEVGAAVVGPGPGSFVGPPCRPGVGRTTAIVPVDGDGDGDAATDGLRDGVGAGALPVGSSVGAGVGGSGRALAGLEDGEPTGTSGVGLATAIPSWGIRGAV